jgi:hypothetical protein
MPLERHVLSSSWYFRDRDSDEWLHVPVVPSSVQQDLIHNKKYISTLLMNTGNPMNLCRIAG